MERWQDREERQDRRTALVCTVLANSVPRKKGSSAFTIDDFLVKRKRPRDEKAERKRSQEQLAAALRSIGKKADGETGDNAGE